MMRPTRLERRLAKALDPVVEQIDGLTQIVAIDLAVANQTAVTKVADAERRVTAATAQADERVLFAERQAADAVAAVRAEVAGVDGNWRGQVQAVVADRDALRVELDRMTKAWQARTEQLGASEARADAAEYRAAVLEVSVESLTDALARSVDLNRRAVEKVPAKTTRRRYEAELAALTEPPAALVAVIEPEVADSA